jgi:hypothetical protein
MNGRRKFSEWPNEWWAAIGAGIAGVLGLWGSGVLFVAGYTVFGVANLVFGLALLVEAFLLYKAGEDD